MANKKVTDYDLENMQRCCKYINDNWQGQAYSVKAHTDEATQRRYYVLSNGRSAVQTANADTTLGFLQGATTFLTLLAGVDRSKLFQKQHV